MDPTRSSVGPEQGDGLVAAAQRGEPGAIDALIAAHLDDLRAYVRLQLDPRLRVRESSSDVVQSVCREVLRDLPRFGDRGPGAFRAWLFAAALNKIRRKRAFHRARKRDVGREVRVASGDHGSGPVRAGLYLSLAGGEPSPSQQAIAHEQAERIERAIDRLPADYREVLLLARVVGLSGRQVAERMGRSEAAVRTLLTRAGIRLLAALEERDGDPETAPE